MKQFIFPLKVYIEDTDYSGLVFHANYLNYFERARSESVEILGLGIEWQAQHEIYFPVRSIQIDYLKPARLNNQLEVISQIVNIKKASIIYDQHLRLANSPDTILCKATVKIACVNKHIRPCAIPYSGLHEILMGEPE
ncbi:MAG: YbgC/FadM family acyl-CoA thioesterase [Gammaproteobacteria bacterium]|nr:YbgC/FadM family acyl-CoA thioesterase [Gammaproteobacteria bacterium]